MPLNLIFTQPGNFTIDDNGIPGDNISVIRDGNGVVIFTFAHPADALGLTVNTPGVNLTINFTDSMAAADFSIGSLTNAAITPDSVVMRNVRTTGDVTLVSNGSITEGGSDAAADIVAGTLILSAVTGIGTAGNAIETQTSFIEAETVTGGLNLRNTGSVQIGGITDQVNGLDVLTSGDLTLFAVGSIFLSDIDLDPGTNPPNPPAQTVHGGDTSGNVTLTASGFLTDIIANTDTDAISAPRGNIILTAGRDIAFGTIGVDFDNDVRANGSVTINAGRDFLLDGFSDLSSDDFFNNTGGGVNITTGRNIHLRNVAGSDATVTASGTAGADVIFTTGFGGAVILDAPSATALSSSSGDINIKADRLLINAASGITANTGNVFIQAATAGRAMLLGSASDAALAVEISDTELDRIFTPNLTLGTDTAGPIRVIAPISPAAAPNLILRTANSISIEASITTGASLTMFAGDNVNQLAATTINTGSLAVFVDQAQDDSGLGGSATFLGTVIATTSTLIGNFNSDILTGGGSNDVIFGFAGDDQITGNGGNDELRGQGGNDTVLGGAGADHLFGGPGNDTMDGGDDNDAMEGGADNDNMSGGLGNDVLFGVNGDDTLDGGSGDDELRGQSGTDTVTGGVGFDHLFGGPGNDELFGGADGDQLFGGADNDTLRGEGGNDLLTGELGSDLLLGGTGNDQFIFRTIADSLPGSADGVGDLTVGDLIDLTQIDADVGVGGDQAFTFIAAAAFSNVAGQLRAVPIAAGQWTIEGDVNGDGVADFVLAVAVADAHALTGADFVL